MVVIVLAWRNLECMLYLLPLLMAGWEGGDSGADDLEEKRKSIFLSYQGQVVMLRYVFGRKTKLSTRCTR